EVGYGNDFTDNTIGELYKTIEERRKSGLPLYGKAVVIEQREGEPHPVRVGLTITHDGGILEHEHTEYEE
ncbi:MAG: hypothetical protein WDA13_03770, partial [Candidatus Shapirobacteria bacterium]